MKSLAPIALIILSIAAFFFYIKPQYEKVKAVRELVKEDERVLAEAANILDTRNQLANNYNTLISNPENMDRLIKALPDGVNNVQLTLDLDTIAAKYKGRISKVTIADAPAVDTSVEDPMAAPLHQEQTISFTVSMSYENVLKFLADIEHSLRLIDVVGMQFTPQSTSLTQYQIILKAYWLQ